MLGMSKHRKSGHSHNNSHFTGKKTRMTAYNKNRKQKLTVKQKKEKRGSHINKYA